MAQIIASTYELLEQIGSGGGGIVYRGRHIRLDKDVVLKADRRTLTTAPEVLRREVDALKNLSHTYIPQVYDYVEEGGVVYTVMDFIQGESLDKSLKSGQHFSQPQVIEWACQLLDALRYLHSRPPHGILHSDIKPANIMLTPEGDIRLIDFNIALALGEDGSVRVGYSRGYASPEHYGLDYTKTGSSTRTTARFSTIPTKQAVLKNSAPMPATGPVLTQTETVDSTDILVPGADTSLEATELLPPSGAPKVPSGPEPVSAGDTSSKKTVVLDVRSDIYSLGATLYHLLTGIKPAEDAKSVMPINASGVSPTVSAIIRKAMSPDPDDRYQSAQEMLDAFEHLHDRDPRTVRHKRRVKITAAVLACMFLAGGLCSFTGLRQMKQAEQMARIEAEQAEAEQRAAKQALAAVGESEAAYRQGDLPLAAERAMEALRLDSPYTAQAQLALTNALGVYDLSDGFRPDRMLTLPSEPLRLVLSPGGTRLGAITAFQADIIDLDSGETLAQLPMEPSALSQLVFLDEERLIYAGERGVTAYNLTGGATLWTGEAATGLALSGDGKKLAAVYKDEDQARIYDTASGVLAHTVSFQGRRQAVQANDIFADAANDLFALDASGNWLAVSFSDGSLVLFDLAGGEELELLQVSSDSRFEGGFCQNYFAFSAWDGSESICAVVDMAQLAQTAGFSASTPFHVQADARGIFLSMDNLMVRLDPATGEQTELAYPEKDIALFSSQGTYSVTASKESRCAVFDGRACQLAELELEDPCDFLEISGDYAVIGSRNTSSVRLLKREDHSDAYLFSYDPSYSHQEARLSADGSRVMLFSYTGFCLYNIDGSLIAQTELPDAEQVYDQQFRREEDGTSYLEVFYNDGTMRSYSAQDGSLLNERVGEKPSGDLSEEFFTDRLRIISPLHETPAAYDRETGELVSELEKDAFLTYVTQAGDFIITEYVSAQGERYGLLLDESCQVLARMPNLCDIIGDTLVFDYPSGNLRQCRIYSLQELMALAE